MDVNPKTSPALFKGKRIDARVLKSALLSGEIKYLNNKTIFGVLDLDRIHLQHAIQFKNCRFEEPFSARDARFDGALDFTDSVLHKGICLRGASIKGRLVFRNATIYGTDIDRKISDCADSGRKIPLWSGLAGLYEVPPIGCGVDLQGLRTSQSIDAERLTATAVINLAGAKIHGTLWMRGVRSGSRKAAGGLNLRGAHVYGRVILSPTYKRSNPDDPPRRSVLHGHLVMAGTQIDGAVDLKGIIIKGRLHAPYCIVRDRLELDAWVSQQSGLKAKYFRTYIRGAAGQAVRLHDAHIGRSIWLSGAIIGSQINLKNCHVGGDIMARDKPNSHNSQLRVEIGYGDGESIRALGLHVDGSIELDHAICHGAVNYENARIGGELFARSIAILNPNKKKTAMINGLGSKILDCDAIPDPNHQK